MAQLVYRRYGGSLQVDIPDFHTLTEAVRIPATQWMALACPLEGIACDPRFLTLMDADGNGRIRVEELRAAVDWTAARLKDAKGADAGSDVLELAALSDTANNLRGAAELVLRTLHAPDVTRLSLEQLRTSDKALRDAGTNGDGIIAPTSLPERLRPLAQAIIAAFPAVTNRAGLVGVNAELVKRFREERTALLAHLSGRDSVFTWGTASLEQAKRVHDVAPLLDGYFVQCRLVAAQPEAAASLRLRAERVEGALGDVGAMGKAVGELPIAPPDPSGVLVWARLYRGPGYERLEAFHQEVATPLLGDGVKLTDTAWKELSTKAEAILAWQAKRDTHALHAVADTLSTVSDEELDALEAASREDLSLKGTLDVIAELERLVLYQRWLLVFANNFISMPSLYLPKRRALMERGTLILAGRKYTLSVLVKDRAAHSALTGQGTTCILYVKVLPKDGAEGYEVAVPVTAGRSTELVVGKRGVFYDVDGVESDAIVTQVVRQPVSLWESMTMPFMRIGAFISGKVEKLAASGEKEFDSTLEHGYTQTVTAPPAGAAPAAAAPAAPAAGGLAGVLAAGGIAFAALGSSLAFILTQVKSLTLVDVITAATILAIVVMAPAGLLGWLKLRRRNLALLLEGSGWALNDRLMLTRGVATLITRRPKLPKNARVDRSDLVRGALRHTQDDDESDGMSVGARLGLTLLVLFILLWQVRVSITEWMCTHRWLSEDSCRVFLPKLVPSELPGAPVVAPAAPAPVPAK
ncbi:kinesin [Corallococcus praedator]|uniref:Kinesin n=1 Tax=Corallococcus praedator TaxID=2316724 RepID=A0ABX9QMA4_9BACT|nr:MULTISPECIES: kinesin [Corallococcus]RKH10294.1 kinesin [Corallococcus sp. CA047B]RKH26266.1 kinesin [Corallococcus sp. CA031C]RKI12521.1 kinesin [Corallococcus praedator]